MKKVMKWSGALAAILGLSILGGAVVNAASVSAEQAKAIAIEHAGVSASDVDYVRVKRTGTGAVPFMKSNFTPAPRNTTTISPRIPARS